MKTATVKAGIVGLGLVSTSHYKGYASHPAAQVVAVCDLDRPRAERFARERNIPEIYTSYEEMLQEADINVVDIATPTYLHIPMALQAIKAGKHVHCEKPFCRYTGEGLEAAQAARQAGVKLVVGETYVFLTSHMKARELIEAGEIGRPLQIRERQGAWIAREKPRIDIGPADRSWRIDPRKSGGGDYPWIFDHAVHFFAAAEYFLPGQRVDQVFAVMGTFRGVARSGAAHDPYHTASLDIPILTWTYEDTDCQGIWMRAERLNGKYDYMRGISTAIIGEGGLIEVLGEGGHNLLWNGEQQHLVLHREGKEPRCFRFDEGGDDVWQSDIAYYSQGHIHHVHHLIDCILNDREPRYGALDGVRAVQCTLAAIRSARENRPVRIKEIGPDFKLYTE